MSIARPLNTQDNTEVSRRPHAGLELEIPMIERLKTDGPLFRMRCHCKLHRPTYFRCGCDVTMHSVNASDFK
jgi:hypothetical protein